MELSLCNQTINIRISWHNNNRRFLIDQIKCDVLYNLITDDELSDDEISDDKIPGNLVCGHFIPLVSRSGQSDWHTLKCNQRHETCKFFAQSPGPVWRIILKAVLGLYFSYCDTWLEKLLGHLSLGTKFWLLTFLSTWFFFGFMKFGFPAVFRVPRLNRVFIWLLELWITRILSKLQNLNLNLFDKTTFFEILLKKFQKLPKIYLFFYVTFASSN